MNSNVEPVIRVENLTAGYDGTVILDDIEINVITPDTAAERQWENTRAAELIKDETVCIRCGLCAERCPSGAITMERLSFEEKPVCQKS